jgi:hypothetical protein
MSPSTATKYLNLSLKYTLCQVLPLLLAPCVCAASTPIVATDETASVYCTIAMVKGLGQLQ